MRHNVLKTVILYGLILLLSSCVKESKEAPTSFVDRYDAPLTESAGTTYEGSYLPLRAGNFWEYDGFSAGGQTVRTVGSIDGITIDTTIEVTLSGSAYIARQQENVRILQLESGTFALHPEVEYTDLAIGSYPRTDTLRYYLGTEHGVEIKAIKTSAGGIAETTDPAFIKSPLVVGDSWDSTPTANIAQLYPGDPDTEYDVVARCKMYVIGGTEIEVRGAQVETVRLDEVIDFEASASSLSGEIAEYWGFVINSYYLQEDSGIVAQSLEADFEGRSSYFDTNSNYSTEFTLDLFSEVTLKSRFIVPR